MELDAEGIAMLLAYEGADAEYQKRAKQEREAERHAARMRLAAARARAANGDRS